MRLPAFNPLQLQEMSLKSQRNDSRKGFSIKEKDRVQLTERSYLLGKAPGLKHHGKPFCTQSSYCWVYTRASVQVVAQHPCVPGMVLVSEVTVLSPQGPA